MARLAEAAGHPRTPKPTWADPLTDEEWSQIGVAMDLATFCRVAELSESSVRRAIKSGDLERLGIRAMRLNSKFRFSVKEGAQRLSASPCLICSPGLQAAGSGGPRFRPACRG